MATFKPTVRGKRKDGFMQVYIRVTHRRCHGYIKTDKMVTDRELAKSGEIKDAFVLNYCTQRIIEFNERLNRQDVSQWSVAEVVEFLVTGDAEICFSDYARQHIDRMLDRGQERTARNYRWALQHMERFFGTTRVMFSHLTSPNMERWIQSLEAKTKRAKSMYPICMRQVFRCAVNEFNDYDNGIIRIKTNPWGRVKIPEESRARKLAISPEKCREFFSSDLPESKMVAPLAEFGRDVAKLVLCLAGMNTVDLYQLRKEDYRNGCVCYKRAKTKRSRNDEAYFEMRVEPIIQPLFEKYKADDKSPYLFNFHDRFSTSDSFCANVNTGIKKVCKDIGAQPYCVYTFRHTWGTVAQNDCKASISDVAFGMNHSNGHAVTRGYIKIDFSPAWELNRKVVDFIFNSTTPSKQEAVARGADETQEVLFRLSPKMMVYGRAYFRGEILAEVSDIGFSTIEEVIGRLAEQLPDTIPPKCSVQFRIKNCDTDREAVYERKKGFGF